MTKLTYIPLAMIFVLDFAAQWLLLPQSAPEGAGLVLELVKTFGVLIVLAWYLFYTQTRVMPNMQKDHRESILNDQQEARAANERMVKEHSEQLKLQRENFSQQLERERELFKALLERIAGK